jgi:SAM-dependent methyltransferase
LRGEAGAFYDREYSGSEYASFARAEAHHHYPEVKAFIEQFGLHGARCLEIGCGRGALQDLVKDYTGTDISESVRPFLRKPFVRCTATQLPFEADSFDAAWSIAVLEHVDDPERALGEIRRVLKPGGLLFLSPAWQCRSWAADGYPVRPYGDFDWRGKLVKASIPLRDSVLWRSMFIIPRRASRRLSHSIQRRPTAFRFRRLTPNYQTYWMADSDAVSAMDPHEAIMWFTSRGDECLNYPTTMRQFLVRTGPLIFRIRK